jgi:H/ACA ribonucleoprotein complex subunit 4
MSFEILEKDENGKDFLFRTEVQGGTYIRKLIDDLGKELGIGAHMLELRRVRAGIFNENDKEYPTINLYDFEKAVDEYNEGNEEKLREIIIPGEIVSELYSSVDVNKESIKKLYNGSPVFLKDLNEKNNIENDRVCIFSNNKFIGIYNVINLGDVFAKPEFVLQPIK